MQAASPPPPAIAAQVTVAAPQQRMLTADGMQIDVRVGATVESASEIPSALHQIEMHTAIQPAPRNWEATVKREDHQDCFDAMKKLVGVHSHVNDGGRDSSVEAIYEATDPKQPELKRLMWYELKLFGLQKPIELNDMLRLRDTERVMNVRYDPSAQSVKKELTGALVVVVSSLETHQYVIGAKLSVPPSSDNNDDDKNPKRKRFSIGDPRTWFGGKK